MLTAKGEEVNRVQGFEVGTDDYKSRLVHGGLRVKAVLRRAVPTTFLHKIQRQKMLLYSLT